MSALRSWLMPVAACVLFAGCDAGLGPAEREPLFFASIAGDLDVEYAGTGHFRAGSIRRRPAGIGPQLFEIESFGTGSQRDLRFDFTRADGALPEPGVYPLGGNGFRAQLAIMQHGGMAEGYTAVAGELVITATSEERIEGTFRFDGVRNCRQSGGGGVTCVSVSTAADAPRIQVSGRFTAVRGR